MVARFDRNVLLHEVSDFVDKAAAEAMDVEAGCKAGIVGTVPAAAEGMEVASLAQELSLRVSSCEVGEGLLEDA